MLSDVGQSVTASQRQSLNCPSTLAHFHRHDCDYSSSSTSSPLMILCQGHPRLRFTSIATLEEPSWTQLPFPHQQLSSIRQSSQHPLCNGLDLRPQKPRGVNRRHRRLRQLLPEQKARSSPNNPRAAMVCNRAMPSGLACLYRVD